ncbi:MAG: TVP38/TMEM64 family protein [Lentihominibacter sp.]|jgi:uncharacterized membrane protein YdjX (TVP38/TMEM64 family)
MKDNNTDKKIEKTSKRKEIKIRASQTTRIRRIVAVVKLFILMVLLIAIPAYIFLCQRDLIERFSSIEDVKAILEAYKLKSIPLYILFQILQIVICVIPGQALQFAAGYMYGFWFGYLLSLVGATLGTVLTYYLARVLSRDAMRILFGEEKLDDMLNKINSKRGMLVVFLIYLIPGVPKDLCTYAAGLSNMKLKPFLILSLIGRTPGMMGSLLIGHQILAGGYISAGVIGAVAVVLFILGIIFRHPLFKLADNIYDKLSKMI